MLYLILALVALGLISAIFGIISHRKGEDEEPLQEGVSCNTCNGENSKCEQECMMEAATKEIEYYDDEELDRFAGRAAVDAVFDSVSVATTFREKLAKQGIIFCFDYPPQVSLL